MLIEFCLTPYALERILQDDKNVLDEKDSGVLRGRDGKMRCYWVKDDPLYQHYHDNEWGRPVEDNARLFEKISLEGFQTGLSWITILRKRENFRQAFDSFDFHTIALYGDQKIDDLMKNDGIIRHIGKIRSVINNAKSAIKLVDEFGSLHNYFWSFRPDNERANATLNSRAELVASSVESHKMAQDLKRRGWRFVGPTTCYAFMQAMGLVNDHFTACDFCNIGSIA